MKLPAALAFKAVPYLALVGTLGTWRACDVKRQRAIGARDAKIELVTDSLKNERDSTRVYRRLTDSIARASAAQRATLTAALANQKPVHVTVDRWLHDTIPVPVAVVRELVKVDSAALEACLALNSTCDAEKAALRQEKGSIEKRLTLTEDQRDLYRQQVPSFAVTATRSLRDASLGAIIALVVHNLLKK